MRANCASAGLTQIKNGITILTSYIDRAFSAKTDNRPEFQRMIKDSAKHLLSATEPISEDSTGILLESLLEGYAEFYSAELSEKVIRGMTENALKCQYNGGAIPLGYTVDEQKHFLVDPLTAPFIVETFQMYDAGKTVKQIVDHLNSRNVDLTTRESQQRLVQRVKWFGYPERRGAIL